MIEDKRGENKVEKKIKIIVLSIFFFLILFLTKEVNAIDVTKKLYQDITINNDGSIKVKEVALLDGEYNGRLREIDFKDYSSTTFTGIYSNFSGDTDIYNGTSIKDIKIYDISQNNFQTIDDIGNVEKEYKEVKRASNGDYGVYTVSIDGMGADFKIYCPSKKKKIFYMEYTIEDAVVIHKDVAELYWNVLGKYYEENIEDFQVKVHLPGEDNNLRIWTHGPLSGENQILDKQTLFFKDTNVPHYTEETIRIMFDKNLIPYGIKESGVEGRENILKYEQAMADTSNTEREKRKFQLINTASQAVLDLEANQRIYYYNYALECVSKIDNIEEKQGFLNRIYSQKEIVNQNWKESINYKINSLKEENYRYLNSDSIENLEEMIKEGFDEKAKEQYQPIILEFNDILAKKDANTRKTCIAIVSILYVLLLIVVVYKIIKLFIERNTYKGKYYRDFPSEANPYVVEYLMKRKITNTSFSATILNLIANKVIKLEKSDQEKNDFKLILENKTVVVTKAEDIVLQLLFYSVGNGSCCYISKLKKYGTTETRARILKSRIDKFQEEAKKEAEEKQYFTNNTSSVLLKILIVLNYVFSLFMTIGVFKGIDNYFLNFQYYLITTSLITFIYYVVIEKDKNRNNKGKLEYSKWLSHKRFLKDFSMLEERELPEIALWEKYLVTATVLGCADKVQKMMKLHISDFDTSDEYIFLATSLNYNLTRTINHTINQTIHSADQTISASTHSSSSGGGFGGGSSGGGRTEVGGGGGGRF